MIKSQTDVTDDLIKCPTCNHGCHKLATACSDCGRPFPGHQADKISIGCQHCGQAYLTAYKICANCNKYADEAEIPMPGHQTMWLCLLAIAGCIQMFSVPWPWPVRLCVGLLLPVAFIAYWRGNVANKHHQHINTLFFNVSEHCAKWLIYIVAGFAMYFVFTYYVLQGAINEWLVKLLGG